MDQLLPEIRKQYDIIAEGSNLEIPGLTDRDTQAIDVLKAHYILCDYFVKNGEQIGCYGPKNISMLLSAVARQVTNFRGSMKWKTDYQRCATLFYGLVKNHPFHDGNKRTALLTTLYNMDKLGFVFTCKHKELEQLSIRIASVSYTSKAPKRGKKKDPDDDIMEIARFLKSNTRKKDYSKKIMTYNELEPYLNKYGFYFCNHKGNYIEIVKRKPKLFGLLDGKSYFVLRIGCPSKKAQINVKAFKSILKNTGLNEENDIDMKVLFEDQDPFYALLDSYKAPLKRLKDK